MDSIVAELSKTVELFYSQYPLFNVNVPRIDYGTDPFLWIADYESATAALTDDQRRSLLVKAFPSGSLRNWYEKTIASLPIDTTWKAVKDIIIERFSGVEDQDRHLRRITDLQFTTKYKLYDQVEEFFYSFGKAFPTIEDDNTKIRFVKSKLPSAIHFALMTIPAFNTATSVEELKKAIRMYDRTYNGQALDWQRGPSGKETTSDLVKTIKGLIEAAVKQHSQEVYSAANARGQSPTRPHRQDMSERYYQRRDQSPGYSGYHRNQERSRSPRYTRSPRGSPSPTRRVVDTNQSYKQQQSKTNYNKQTQNYPSEDKQRDQYKPEDRQALPKSSQTISKQEEVFDIEGYYKKFGKPPSPCPNCQRMHWIRHCHENLN